MHEYLIVGQNMKNKHNRLKERLHSNGACQCLPACSAYVRQQCLSILLLFFSSSKSSAVSWPLPLALQPSRSLPPLPLSLPSLHRWEADACNVAWTRPRLWWAGHRRHCTRREPPLPNNVVPDDGPRRRSQWLAVPFDANFDANATMAKGGDRAMTVMSVGHAMMPFGNCDTH